MGEVNGRTGSRRLPTRGTAALAAVMLAAGCAGQGGEPPANRTTTGAAIGAAVGGLAGAVLDDRHGRGALLGAAAGAALGGGLGYWLDRQKGELEQALATERAADTAEVERVQDDLLKVTINDELAFDYKSTAIRPSFLPTLERVAGVLERYQNSRVAVVGHTDAVGPDAYNQQLSEARAEAVRDALVTYGVDQSRIRAEGRGEREPRAENDSETGRERNRRVEILITPVA